MTHALRSRTATHLALLFACAALAATSGCATGATTADGLDGSIPPGSVTVTGSGGPFGDAGGGPVFLDGSKGASTCSAPETTCGGICTSTLTDPNNCGLCGNICPSGSCSAGACGTGTGTGTGGCSGAQISCGGVCTDITADPNNCGACGNACGAGSCTNSMCSSSTGSCTGGQTSCPTGCTDTTSDPSNCGSCDNVCPSGSCTASVCDSSSSGGGCAHSPCTVGAALVDGCDDDADMLVSGICEGDQPQCCTTAWDANCVSEATSNCQDPFGGGDLCTDPGC